MILPVLSFGLPSATLGGTALGLSSAATVALVMAAPLAAQEPRARPRPRPLPNALPRDLPPPPAVVSSPATDAAVPAARPPTSTFDLPPSARRAIGLEEAVGLALTQNRTLARRSSLLKTRDLDIDSAEAAFDYRIRPSGTAGISDGSEDLGGGLGIARKFRSGTDVEVRGRYNQSTINDLEENRGGLAVEISQPLFRNHGRLIHEEPLIAARERLKAAQRVYEGQKADLVLEVIDSFARLIELENQIAADEAFSKRMNLLFRRSQALEQLGKSSKLDVLRVELQAGQSEARLANTRELYFFNMREFADLLGFPPATDFELIPPPRLELRPFTTAEAVSIALANRLDYAQLIEDLDARERGVLIARRQLKPDISLVSRYERFGEGPRSGDAFEFDEDGWFLGLRAGSDLNTRREQTGIDRAKIEQDVAVDDIRLREINIARSVQQQMSVHRRSQAQERIAKRNVELAKKQADLAKQQYELGTIDNFTATDAEEQWIEAQTALASAEADVLRAGYRLLRILGVLIEVPDRLRPKLPTGAPSGKKANAR